MTFSIFALSLWAVLLSGTLFLLMPYGHIAGILIFLGILSILILAGDRILLMAMEAHPLNPDSELISMAKNFSCHLEMNDVSFFTSKKYGNNFYFFDGPLGPVIVGGEKLMDVLSPTELKAVLFYTLTLVCKKESLLRVWINLAFLPFYLLFSLQRKGHFQKLFSDFFLSPLNYLKDHLLIWCRQDTSLPLKRELLSALFKIGQLDAPCETNPLEGITRNFTVSFNNNNRFAWSLADKKNFYPSG